MDGPHDFKVPDLNSLDELFSEENNADDYFDHHRDSIPFNVMRKSISTGNLHLYLDGDTQQKQHIDQVGGCDIHVGTRKEEKYKQKPFISLAEMTNKFWLGTPDRFRSKPNLQPNQNKRIIPKFQMPRLKKTAIVQQHPANGAIPKDNKPKSTKAFQSSTVPKPFSFEKRDKEIQKRKEEAMQKVLEDEKKARMFHAKPIPKGLLNNEKKSSTSSINSARSDDNVDNVPSTSIGFKAKPATVLYKPPFIPKKPQMVIKPMNIALSTEARSKAREDYERKLQEKQEMTKLQQEAHQAEMNQREARAIAKLRKEMQFTANPIRQYNAVDIQPSNQMTIPKTPRVLKTRCRSNKENESVD